MSGVEPIRRELVIDASADTAFRVFTTGIDRWWPRQHHIGTSPLKRAVLEARVDGRWYGLSEDDSECDVGKVLVWDPPRRLLLAWQINAEWKYDPAFVTEVEVNFIPEAPKRTRMKFEHRDLHRYGTAAAKLRAALDAPGGWGGTLEAFSKTATGDVL